MDLTDLIWLCSKYLCIDYQSLKRRVENGNRLTLEHLSTVKTTDLKKTSVIITTLTEIDSKDCNILLELKRPFFAAVAAVAAKTVDPSVQQFELGKLLRFLSRYKYSIKQLSLTYLDTEKCLTEREVFHFCANSKDYCVGTLVKWRIPEIVTKKNVDVGCQRRIKLGASDSKSNYGVISIASKTGRVSVALKIRKKEKIEYVLQDYGNYIQQLQDFQTRCRALLVSCIDFIKPSSKRARVKAGYVRHPSWAAFLGQQGRIEAINWSRVYTAHT
jgi:hypothetical protein